ncbi:proline--tRNA ligase, partial [bacterium]
VHQIKTLVYVADETPVLLLLRGDHQLNDAKASSALGAGVLRTATAEEIFDLLGAHPGSLGAVKVEKLRIFADSSLEGRTHMTTGANKDGYHLRGVDVARDIKVERFADLREAREGEQSPRGGGALQSAKCIEIGHVFKLGNKYSKAMNATFLDQNGKSQIFEMGCYGIGVSRIMAAVAEASRDDRGPIWPAELAPYAVHLLLLDKDEELKTLAEGIYQQLLTAGVEVLFDDRNERPGAKFADADLFGIPTQIVVGKTTRENGLVEVRKRADKSSENVAVAELSSLFN